MTDLWVILWVSFASYLYGPDKPYSDCCAYVNDLYPPNGAGDGVIEIRDFAAFQNGYSCNPAPDWCGYFYRPQVTK